ncbi:MAG: hypothetical protein PHP50_09775 [Lachnospiraceae bacterium]|nr:hypothetical protein [Lachnospiraceae bacterium]
MRKQTTKIHAGSGKRKLMILACILLLVAAAFLIWQFIIEKKQTAFVPPEFDPAAQSGTPTPDEGLGYSVISAENSFSFGAAGTMYQQEDGSILLYFTNPEYSQCNMSCEIRNEERNAFVSKRCHPSRRIYRTVNSGGADTK